MARAATTTDVFNAIARAKSGLQTDIRS